MSEMLERAARAVWNPKALGLQDHEIESVWMNQDEEDRQLYRAVARAVLMAVREPDEALVAVGEEKIDFHDTMPEHWRLSQTGAAFTAMIDAILNGGDQ